MNQEEIIAFNRLCAEFLGCRYCYDDPNGFPNGYWISDCENLDIPYLLEDMLFHSDWNWIMEVINKAEDGYTVGQRVYFKIHPFGISVYCSGVAEKNLDYLHFELLGKHFKGELKKEAVVKAIYQFLIWYNLKKP